MKKFVAVALFSVSTFVVPTVFVATPASALTCGVDAPPQWERPGGFCDALRSNSSLTTPVEGQAAKPIPPCKYGEIEILRLLRDLNIGDRILVADDPCMNMVYPD